MRVFLRIWYVLSRYWISKSSQLCLTQSWIPIAISSRPMVPRWAPSGFWSRHSYIISSSRLSSAQERPRLFIARWNWSGVSSVRPCGIFEPNCWKYASTQRPFALVLSITSYRCRAQAELLDNQAGLSFARSLTVMKVFLLVRASYMGSSTFPCLVLNADLSVEASGPLGAA